MSRNATLMVLNLAHFFDHLFLLIFPTAAIALSREWGMGYGEVLAFATPLYVMFAIGTLPSGWLGDRFERSGLIVLFFVGCGLSSILIGFSTGPWTLMCGLGLMGLFASIYHPVGLAMITDVAVRTGRALAVNGVFGNLGLAGAVVFTGVLTEWGGWRSAFLVPGVLSLILGAFVLTQRRGSTARPRQASHPSPSAVSTTRRAQVAVFAVVCVAALFGGMVFNVITLSLPKFFDERLLSLDGDLGWIGASSGLVFAVAAFAQLPTGELLDRFGARGILITLMTGEILLLVLLAGMSGWSALGLAVPLVTLIFAGIPVTSWLLGRYLRSDIRSRALSVEYMLSLGVGSAVVPLLALFHQRGFGFEIQFNALALCSLAVLVAACFLPRFKRSGVHGPALRVEPR